MNGKIGVFDSGLGGLSVLKELRKLLPNENYLFYEYATDNLNINNIDLPKYENIWFRGFKWKGLFIQVIPQEKSKFIINEVKSLNYFFLDFIQIVESYKNFQHNKNPLSNYIIFPLMRLNL